MSNDYVFNYGTQGLFIGSTSPYSATFESSGSTPINALKSSAITLDYPRQDMNDFAGGGTPFLSQGPTANLDFAYLFEKGINEQNMGFVFNGQTPALLNMNNERNYYVLINQGNNDLIGYSGLNNYTLAFGNGVITKYSLQASVNQATACSVSVNCLNVLVQGTGTGNIIPSINKQSGAASTGQYRLPAFSQSITNAFESAPSSIVLTINTGASVGTLLSGANSCPLQNFSFSIDLSRLPSKNIGWSYPATRSVRYPITISIKADAYLNGLQIDSINRFTCPDSGWNFNVGFFSQVGVADPMSFSFTNAKLDSQTFSAGVGGYNKVSMSWTAKIYDINRVSGNAANFFINYPQSAYNSIVFSGVNNISGAGGQGPLTLNLNQYAYLSVIQGSAFINGNLVVMTQESPNQVVVQALVSGGAEVENIVVTM